MLLSHVVERFRPAGMLDRVVMKTWFAGWIGVDLFFVLSGFLITGILLDTRADRHCLRSFFARRALRILPPYYALLALLMVATRLLLPSGDAEAAALAASMPWHLSYLSNALVAVHGWSGAALNTGHLWSLAVEEQFYLAWPLVVLVLAPQRLRTVLLATLVALPLVRGLALAMGIGPVPVYVLTPFRADTLLGGALLAVIMRDAAAAQLLGLLRRAGKWALVALALLAFGLEGLPSDDGWMQTVGYTALTVAFMSVLARVLTGALQGRPSRVLSWGPLTSFGRYSYAIYLVHAPLLLLLDRAVFARNSLPLIVGTRLPALLAYTFGFLLLTWTIGALSWWGFERYFLALKRHFPAAPPAAPPGQSGTLGRQAA